MDGLLERLLVVNEVNEAVVVYTGADKPFTRFDVSLLGKRTDPGFAGRGAYTTDNRNTAAHWGRYVMSTVISGGRWIEIRKRSDLLDYGYRYVENSSDLTKEEINSKMSEIANEFADRMIEKGYDGVKWHLSTGDTQYVLFKPDEYEFKVEGRGDIEVHG